LVKRLLLPVSTSAWGKRKEALVPFSHMHEAH